METWRHGEFKLVMKLECYFSTDPIPPLFSPLRVFAVNHSLKGLKESRLVLAGQRLNVLRNLMTF